MLRQLEFALFDFTAARRLRPGSAAARVAEVLARGARRGRGHCRCRTGTASRTASRTFLPAATPPATTATSGPRCSPPMPSRPSRKHGVFDRATAQRFLDCILSQGGSRDPLEAFIEFRGRRPEDPSAAAPERHRRTGRHRRVVGAGRARFQGRSGFKEIPSRPQRCCSRGA